jgi:hypothetical protein
MVRMVCAARAWDGMRRHASRSKESMHALELTAAASVPFPAQSAITHAYDRVHLADSFAIGLPAGASGDPLVLARFLFAQQPAWVGGLMWMRDLIVALWPEDREAAGKPGRRHQGRTRGHLPGLRQHLGRDPFHPLANKKIMSRSAYSAQVFSIYLFIAGAVLVAAPNVLLAMFRLPETSEAWIRVIGILAFNIGIYAWVAARHEDRSFFETSVYTRVIFFIAVTTFAVLGLAGPTIILFGVPDLLGAIWTHLALKADARQGRPALASQG